MSEKTPHSVNPEFAFWAYHKLADKVISGFKEFDEDGAIVLEEGIGYRFYEENGQDKGNAVLKIGGTVKPGGKTESLVSQAYQEERKGDHSPHMIIWINSADIDLDLNQRIRVAEHQAMVVLQITEIKSQKQHELYPDNDEFLDIARTEVKLGPNNSNQNYLYRLRNFDRTKIRWGLDQFLHTAFLNRDQRDLVEEVAKSYR